MRPKQHDLAAARGDSAAFWSTYQPGFRVTHARPGTREFYEQVERHRYATEPAIPEFARFGERLGARVLELGCGIGTDGANFARNGAAYTGLDPSPTALSLARERFDQEALDGEFVEGSATALPFPDNSFDLVYSCGVLHHLARTQTAIDEVHRVLRPGGEAVVMLYHRASVNYWFTILVVRRALATILLVPGGERLITRLTGERPEVIDGHRELLREHGLGYLRNSALFLSNNTDGPGNPLSKVYSAADAGRLFASFSQVTTAVRFLNLRLYPGGERFARSRIGRALERRAGWHLWIRAVK